MRKFTAVRGTARQAMRRKEAPRALASASGMNRWRICGANAANQTVQQTEKIRAAFQEK